MITAYLTRLTSKLWFDVSVEQLCFVIKRLLFERKLFLQEFLLFGLVPCKMLEFKEISVWIAVMLLVKQYFLI